MKRKTLLWFQTGAMMGDTGNNRVEPAAPRRVAIITGLEALVSER